MPHTRGAKKRLRQNAKRRLNNRSIKRGLKTLIKRVEDAAEAIVSAAESGGWKAGELSIVNPDYGEEIEIGEMARRIVKLCKSKSKIALNGSKKAPFYYKKEAAAGKIRFKNRSLDAALKKYISSLR